MRTLKRIIYVYDELIFVKQHLFKIETTKDIKKDKDDSLYTLYDAEAENEDIVATTIQNYKGIIEIAEAYLTGDKQALDEAKIKWCFCY